MLPATRNGGKAPFQSRIIGGTPCSPVAQEAASVDIRPATRIQRARNVMDRHYIAERPGWAPCPKRVYPARSQVRCFMLLRSLALLALVAVGTPALAADPA